MRRQQEIDASSRGADLAKVLEGVDAAAVFVGPVNPQSIIPHQLCGYGGEGLGVVAGETGEQGLFLRGDVQAMGVALADGAALGAGAHRTKVFDRVHALAPVGPVDLEALGALEVKAGGSGSGSVCHLRMI